MKIAIGIVLAVAGGIFAFWAAYVRAPAPEAVCRHITAITVREAGEIDLAPQTRDTLLARLEQDCISHKRNKILLRGKIRYASYARCVVGAQTLRQIEDC